MRAALLLIAAMGSTITVEVTPGTVQVSPGQAKAVTDAEVVKAVEKAQAYLISQQKGDGTWPDQKYWEATGDYGNSEMVFFTLAYIGVHPNRDVMTKAIDALMNRNLDYTYAISMRAMAYAHIQKQLASPKREMIRQALMLDVQRLIQFQGIHGGWNYKTLGGSAGRYDLSNTQMAILALREAALAGIEIPDFVWKRTQDLYFKLQKQDGGWNYGEHHDQIGKNAPAYGSMTAAGLASIFITSDNLDPGRGCPCRAGKSNIVRGDLDRRLDAGLAWHEKHFKATENPVMPEGAEKHRLYWLYGVERVGIAAGYKYFGNHNWYREGAEVLLREQQDNGSWGPLPETCFATLFLYKGRAPVLYNKLQFKGEWNNHRRDIANLTTFIEKTKEQQFHWQIVGLQAPVEELHDAPVLYITAETPPTFTDDEKKKLREFTDTGGTIFFEASCGSPAVRKWFTEFAKEVWPEWALKGLGPDHGSFMDPYALKQRPEILGIDDGLRTSVFYAMDDVSCAWNTKAMAGKDYLFKWGINLFTYATDQSPLRAKLAAREPAKGDRYTSPVKAGGKNTLRLARVRYDGPWITGRNYRCFDPVVKALSSKAGVTLKVEEDGVAPVALNDREAAYLAGSGGNFHVADGDRVALKDYLAKGGFLWVEAAGGSAAFDQAFTKAAGEAGWELKPLEKTHPVLTGGFKAALGYNIASGVQFSRTLRVVRLGRTYAELLGIYQDQKLVGVYSPFDVLFSTTGLEAYGRRGYQPEDALAVATNLLIYLTDR